MSDSGRYGPTRVAAGIRRLRRSPLGDRVAAVLEVAIRAGGGAIPWRAHSAAWGRERDHRQQPHATGPHVMMQVGFPGRPEASDGAGSRSTPGSSIRRLADTVDLARAFPGREHHRGPLRRPVWYGPYARKKGRGIRGVEASHHRAREVRERDHELGGMMMRLRGIRLRRAAGAPSRPSWRTTWRPYLETCIDARPERCMFESNYPFEKMGSATRRWWNAFKAHHRRRVPGREACDVQRHRPARATLGLITWGLRAPPSPPRARAAEPPSRSSALPPGR